MYYFVLFFYFISIFLFFGFFFIYIFFFILSIGFFLIDFNIVRIEILSSYYIIDKDISFTFIFDWLSCFFFSFVSLISSVVFFYRKFYINSCFFFYNNNHLRYYFLLFSFVLSIFFLVFSGSWVVVMLGWDGLGLVSFVLVIYFNDYSSLNSGLVTILTNRVGDCFFILGFILMYHIGWFWVDSIIFYNRIFFCFMFFLGCITKSAQLPFSSWLPAAIAAPTPVSSLVHSSTLVTAGVYLIVRFNYIFSSIMVVMSFLSLLTIFLSGIWSIFELDFKKIVAISTLSQLGFIVFSISIGFWSLSFVHMIFHAFFKRSLFMATGNLMHYLNGHQDSRLFGSMYFSFFSKLFFFCSVISLMGFPFSLGFYSKDLILGCSMRVSWRFIFFIFFIRCCFTVSYSIRLISLGFFGFPSFFPSLSFSDCFFFIIPVTFIFFISIFLGDFFFSSIFPPLFFSLFESFVGLLIIFFGCIFYLISCFCVSSWFMSSMGFLPYLVRYFSLFTAEINCNIEQTWTEFTAFGRLFTLLRNNSASVSFKLVRFHYILNPNFLYAFFFITLFYICLFYLPTEILEGLFLSLFIYDHKVFFDFFCSYCYFL